MPRSLSVLDTHRIGNDKAVDCVRPEKEKRKLKKKRRFAIKKEPRTQNVGLSHDLNVN